MNVLVRIFALVAVLMAVLYALLYVNKSFLNLMIPNVDPKGEQLEFVKTLSQQHEGKFDVLFVHGAWGDVRVWENYMSHFVENENVASVAAFSLQAHGNSSDYGYSYKWRRVADYASDINKIVENKYAGDSSKLILVCHSLGGYACQKYLQMYGKQPFAMVLLASIPPVPGPAPSGNRSELREKMGPAIKKCLKQMSSTPLIEDYEFAKFLLHHDSLSDDIGRVYHARMQNESYLTLLDYMARLNTVNLDEMQKQIKPGFNLFALSTDNDRMIPVNNHWSIVRVYKNMKNVKFTEMALNKTVRVAHFMQLDPDWKEVADHILNYISSLVN